MTRARPRQIVLLGVLLAALALLVVFYLVPTLAGPRAVDAAAPQAAARPNGPAARPVVEVDLARLEAAAAEPTDGGRNPFRMGAAPSSKPSGSSPPVSVAPSAPVVPPGPPPPPPVPAIPLRFIGIVSGVRGKIAVLSDGRGTVVHGREGQTVDGRYRIVKIGEQSIEMEHADGRGRQTIRLTGS